MAGKTNRSNATPVAEQEKLFREVSTMLTALEDEDRLTDWEKGFLQNVNDRVYRERRPPSPAQMDRLNEIYARYN